MGKVGYPNLLLRLSVGLFGHQLGKAPQCQGRARFALGLGGLSCFPIGQSKDISFWSQFVKMMWVLVQLPVPFAYYVVQLVACEPQAKAARSNFAKVIKWSSCPCPDPHLPHIKTNCKAAPCNDCWFFLQILGSSRG